MIQVYKKNELFIIENTVTDIIYPNLTREEALVLLKKFDRNEPEHRCDFAIKEDNISFEYVSLDDKDKIIADLEAKLAEKQSKIQELNDMYEDLLVAKGTENELMQVSADCDFFAKENRKLKQQLAEKEHTIKTLIEDSKASKELLKKQLAEKDEELETYKKQFNEQAWLCEEFRFQLEEKDNEIEKLTEELDDKNFCKDFVDLYSENKLKTQMLHKNWKDKISFAVEKLEKVKDEIDDINYFNNESECSVVDSYEIWSYIDNQIEELKKEMK